MHGGTLYRLHILVYKYEINVNTPLYTAKLNKYGSKYGHQHDTDTYG
jgi:hypothetical protein